MRWLYRGEMGQLNLPVQLTSFIGRQREIDDIKRLLFTSPLVTLTGAGGSGKTRLAIQVAGMVGETFTDGVWLVDLAPLIEPALVPTLIVEMLGLRVTADQPVLETLVGFLRSKHALLILDNCEHLREACGELAQALLFHAPELRILATSREPLSIAGEIIYPISGLAWPSIDTRVDNTPQDLMQYDAIRLFVERARAILPNFELTSENARATAEICQRLDGLPLALELASARVNVLTVQEIVTRLNDRLALLVSTQRTGIEPRHQTLRATIDWSYELLPIDEQILLRHLAVFEAGCTLDTAEGICAGLGTSSGNILDKLSSLVTKSLVVADTIGRPQARYRLLETIREYMLGKLDEAGETMHLRNCHLDLFLARAEEAAPKLGESYQQLWLNWLESEHDNLRTALAWSLDSDRIEEGLRLAIALVRFWEIRGYVQEGMGWFERLLAQADERVSPVIHVNALTFASFLAMFLGNTPATLAYGRKAVDIAEGISDDNNSALMFAQAGLISGIRMTGDFQTAFTIGEQLLKKFRVSGGSSLYLGMALLTLGENAIQVGSYDAAKEWLDESLELAQQDGDAFRIAHTFNSLGDLYRLEQNYIMAANYYEKGVALLRELGAQHDMASILANLGYTCLHLGDVARARALFGESMSIHQTQQNKPGLVECLIGCAATAVMGGFPAVGARLLAAAAVISGQPSASPYKATQMEFEYFIDLARDRLTEVEFQEEQVIGSGFSLEQAVDYAQNFALKPGPPSATAPSLTKIPGGLSKREWEVAALIGQGKTNGEIAAELFLSKRTVETHVSKILSKLEFTHRAQIMRWVIDHGLI